MLQDRQAISNVSASTPITLLGGIYLVAVNATWNSTGTVKLQMLGPDGSTYIDIFAAYDASDAEENVTINTFTADGAMVFHLAPGAYQFTIATATAVYASATRVPVA